MTPRHHDKAGAIERPGVHPMTCARCQREKRIANKKRQLCAGCDCNITPAERREYPPILPPLDLAPIPGRSHAAIRARYAAVMEAWKRGYPQAEISRALRLSRFAVWRYINTPPLCATLEGQVN